ncbi:PAS domain-containing protein [Marimonas arenosa]|uniref:PAS domain-containing protein n=1 Tax=Marimonas arenosa TaxID=1795305 RepID=A0AAE3W8K0_9RHOB|nr:PAS domain-containing protein [Marimonas arenosa]MDQ2088606.1 PAS domain-containing protein [Marimonas arenosa]
MSSYRGELGFRALSQVEAYWDGLRQDRRVPQRSDIDPRGIENALEYAFILERIAPGLARLRIAGMHLSDLMGLEVRGMPVSSFIPPAGRQAFSNTLEEVTQRPAVARISLSAEAGIGKPPLEGRMLLLPLMSDFGDISRVLGCFETRGQIGRAPRRFNVIHTELRPLEGAKASRDAPPAPRSSDAAREKARQSVRDNPGFRESQAGFTPRRKPQAETPGPRKIDKSRRPVYLRLVKSDD